MKIQEMGTVTGNRVRIDRNVASATIRPWQGWNISSRATSP